MMPGVRTLAFGTVLLGVTACATTSFKSTWREPTAQTLDLSGKKVLAAVISNRQAVRLAAEDALARTISERKVEALPSYQVLPGELARDTARAREVLTANGFEAIVVMRLLGREKQTTYTPGSATYVGGYYGSTWSYWGYGWGAVYSPGYYREDQVYTVETTVYSVSQNKLIWAGQSETTNPSDVDSFMREIVPAIGHEMRKAGLLPSK